MKKIVSSLLICSILFSSVTPNFCYSAGNKKILSVKNATSKSATSNLTKADLELNKTDKEALKKAILELAKDKNFADHVVKNYDKAHEAPTWLKVVKILCLPFKACWYLIQKAFDYTVGKAAAGFIENIFLPTIIASLTGLAIYKKVPFVNKSVNWVISLAKKSINETE